MNKVPPQFSKFVREFELVEDSFDPKVIRANALRFSTDRFREEFSRFVYARWREHKKNVAIPETRVSAVFGGDAPRYRQVDHEHESVTI